MLSSPMPLPYADTLTSLPRTNPPHYPSTRRAHLPFEDLRPPLHRAPLLAGHQLHRTHHPEKMVTLP
jgi:hypothetical protein